MRPYTCRAPDRKTPTSSWREVIARQRCQTATYSPLSQPWGAIPPSAAAMFAGLTAGAAIVRSAIGRSPAPTPRLSRCSRPRQQGNPESRPDAQRSACASSMQNMWYDRDPDDHRRRIGFRSWAWLGSPVSRLTGRAFARLSAAGALAQAAAGSSVVLRLIGCLDKGNRGGFGDIRDARVRVLDCGPQGEVRPHPRRGDGARCT